MLKKILLLTLVILSTSFSLTLASPIILVQGAMPIEVSVLVDSLSNRQDINIDSWHFWQGAIDGKTVIVSETKVGTTNAAIATLLGIQNFHPSLIINQGTCGGFTAALHLNDIILIGKTYNIAAIKADPRPAGANLDIYGWHLRDDALQQLEFNSDATLLEIAQKAGTNYTVGKIWQGNIASSDRWAQEVDYMNYWASGKNILGEEMESAAASQVAADYGVPILNIRVISDNPINNEPFTMEGATVNAANCQRFVIDIIKNIV